MGTMIEVPLPGGGKAPAWSTGPKSGPAVIVIQEWWGLNDQIKGVAERVAEAGFRALVPDLYRGKLASDADEASHFMDDLDWGGAVRGDIAGAAALLGKKDQPVGVLGFCMGGALTILAGIQVPGLAAAVCFYGIPPASAADPAEIRTPFQGHFGTKDDWCSPSAVEGLKARLEAGEVDYELYSYEADHAFMNEARPEVYAPEAARLAWKRAMVFLDEHLRD
ncbi:MAG: dienelactone hydrolase family protein [Deltaproteobacteria bacterium]|nr:dienelactone hydrolase family protein [Deltaproteobacteria bacterium]MCB9788486.1 dienelactone hydrolase family protein [Deltaproteobacteria bacterium]